jgi:hypothetical protein
VCIPAKPGGFGLRRWQPRQGLARRPLRPLSPLAAAMSRARGHGEPSWRGGRVVECGGLENRCTLAGTEGSNPSLSARRQWTRSTSLDGTPWAYLQISKDGGRLWLFRYQRHGKARAMGLGSFSLVSLAEGREKARTACKLLLFNLPGHRIGEIVVVVAKPETELIGHILVGDASCACRPRRSCRLCPGVLPELCDHNHFCSNHWSMAAREVSRCGTSRASYFRSRMTPSATRSWNL